MDVRTSVQQCQDLVGTVDPTGQCASLWLRVPMWWLRKALGIWRGCQLLILIHGKDATKTQLVNDDNGNKRRTDKSGHGPMPFIGCQPEPLFDNCSIVHTKVHVRTKARWSDEELKILAITELRVPPCTNINQRLREYFPGRSLQSIKSQRKTEKYHTIITTLRSTVSKNIVTPQRSLPIPPARVENPRLTSGTPSRILPQGLPERDAVPSTGVPPLIDRNDSMNDPENDPENNPENDHVSHDIGDIFLRSLLQSSSLCNDDMISQLIGDEAAGINIICEFSDYMGETFKIRPQSNARVGNSDTSRYRRRKKLKRYVRFQQMFRKSWKNRADMIIEGKEDANIFPSEANIRNVYQTIYESPSPADSSKPLMPKQCVNLYYPVTMEEIERFLKNLHNTSPGIDNYTTGHPLIFNVVT